MYGLHYYGIASNVGLHKLKSLARKAKSLDMKDFLFGNSPYMGNYIKPVTAAILRSSDEESSPPPARSSDAGLQQIEDVNAELDLDDEDRDRADLERNEEDEDVYGKFDQYGAHLPGGRSEEEDDGEDEDGSSSDGASDKDDDPDFTTEKPRAARKRTPQRPRAVEGRSAHSSPAPDPRVEDTRAMDSPPAPPAPEQSEEAAPPSCSGPPPPKRSRDKGKAIADDFASTAYIELSDSDDDQPAPSASVAKVVSEPSARPAPSSTSEIERIEEQIAKLKVMKGNSTSVDGKENDCVAYELSWWEEKLARKKLKRENEEALMRKVQELEAAEAKRKLQYDEVLAKAKQDAEAEAKEQFMAELRAKYLNDLRSSQTAGSSTPSIGPLNLAVSTTPATQDSALHLPAYDAPRDPRPEDMSCSLPAPAAVASAAARPASRDPVGNAPPRAQLNDHHEEIPARTSPVHHHPRVEDNSRHPRLEDNSGHPRVEDTAAPPPSPKDASLALPPAAETQFDVVRSTPPPADAKVGGCPPPALDEELVDYEDDAPLLQPEPAPIVPAVEFVDSDSHSLLDQVHSPDLSNPYEY